MKSWKLKAYIIFSSFIAIILFGWAECSYVTLKPYSDKATDPSSNVIAFLGTALLAFFSLIVVVYLTRISKKANKVAFWGMSLITSFLLILSIRNFLNFVFDTSAPELTHAEVVARKSGRGYRSIIIKNESGELYALTTERAPLSGTLYLNGVSVDVYKLRKGDQLTLETKRGTFGKPWVKSISRKAPTSP